jgi:hypothetical protein
VKGDCDPDHLPAGQLREALFRVKANPDYFVAIKKIVP